MHMQVHWNLDFKHRQNKQKISALAVAEIDSLRFAARHRCHRHSNHSQPPLAPSPQSQPSPKKRRMTVSGPSHLVDHASPNPTTSDANTASPPIVIGMPAMARDDLNTVEQVRNIHAHPSVSNHRRPSVPSSPIAHAPRAAQDPRLVPMSNRPSHPIRVPPSPAPSNYSSRPFVGPEIDTKSGGAAGMAGMGRRGFAAATHAAMFAASAPSSLHLPTSPPPALWNSAPSSPPPVDGRRAFPPLNVHNPSADARMHCSLRDSWRLVLRHICRIRIRSPHLLTRLRCVLKILDLPGRLGLRFLLQPHPRPHSGTPPGCDNNVAVKSSSIPFPVRPSHASKPSKASGPLTPTSPTELPFSSSENLSQKRVGSGGTVKVVTQDDTSSSFHMRASEDEGSEFGGLAYAQSDDDSDDEASSGVAWRPLPLGCTSGFADLYGQSSVVEKILSPTSPTVSIPRASKPLRSLTSPTQRDSSTLGGTINRRGGTISGAIGSGSSDKSRRKERLSEESSTSGLGKYRETVFTCMRCSKEIEDNRWIRVENGKGVLCGKCWKNMYLPKCRRCNLPIEKQAVSSSDGQLKGKYHRDCFNCHTCHKPFADKTFYVFDGKPFCDYHYHEANNSLCAISLFPCEILAHSPSYRVRRLNKTAI
ncbi:hypothetical protein BJY52DRAFT_1405826 [Lactarius psammicola]|nr:hypothetical protein BJY52DRAFT_1405826 [Lactarius psammicola]